MAHRMCRYNGKVLVDLRETYEVSLHHCTVACELHWSIDASWHFSAKTVFVRAERRADPAGRNFLSGLRGARCHEHGIVLSFPFAADPAYLNLAVRPDAG